ncbi:hypothetical protein MT325_m538R [Paramecium bursaria chlorella virus MT325]|uniref:Uncharacterized protein m538R n=1 Tax=Paramecium bursaria Chlorella virus MT325 TaxID=346932 RepID=A7IUR8_PBCVM|nr:hypothetical protein MT325_m538R [Paramecium bursaria chlorella virus MT325]
MSPCFIIPMSLAMCLAVSMLSPVTMMIPIPALSHILTAAGTLRLTGSLIPKIASSTSSRSRAIVLRPDDAIMRTCPI